MTTIVILIVQSLLFLFLETANLILQIFEIRQNGFEICSFLIVFFVNCSLLLLLKFRINILKQCIGLIIRKWLFIDLIYASQIMIDLNWFRKFLIATIFLSQINTCDFLMTQYLSNNINILQSYLIKNIHLILVILVNY